MEAATRTFSRTVSLGVDGSLIGHRRVEPPMGDAGTQAATGALTPKRI
jgi:hypothetical protein